MHHTMQSPMQSPSCRDAPHYAKSDAKSELPRCTTLCKVRCKVRAAAMHHTMQSPMQSPSCRDASHYAKSDAKSELPRCTASRQPNVGAGLGQPTAGQDTTPPAQAFRRVRPGGRRAAGPGDACLRDAHGCGQRPARGRESPRTTTARAGAQSLRVSYPSHFESLGVAPRGSIRVAPSRSESRLGIQSAC